MNETTNILLLAIVATWFFTNSRSQALLTVIKKASPSNSNSAAVNTAAPDTTDIPLTGSSGTSPSTIDLNNSNSGVG